MDLQWFVIRLLCALQAGKGHCSLRSLGFDFQFTFKRNINGNPFLKYKDIGIKTNKGGLHHSKISAKVVPIYASSNKEQCPVELFFKYHSQLPVNRKYNVLYLRSLAKPHADGVWYCHSAIGINSLQKTIESFVCK